MMNLDDLTIGEAKQLKAMLEGGATVSHSFRIGQAVFVRTVTYHYTGRIESITNSDIVLSDAAWIADSGRFATALKTGEFNEVEPYSGNVVLNRAAIVDWCEVVFKLPKVQK